MWQRLSLQRLVTWLLVGGYLTLFVETFLDHRGTWDAHPLAYTPVVTALLLSAALLLAAASWRPGPRAAAGWLCLASVLVGLTGLVLHNEDRLEDGFDFASGAVLIPPLLAPLAFAGLGLLGWVILSRKWPEVLVSGAGGESATG